MAPNLLGGRLLKEKLAVLAVLAIALSGCTGPDQGSASPTVTVTMTQPAVTITATPLSPTPPTSPAALGETQTSRNGSAVTVFEHRKNVEPQDPDQEAIDVEVCAPVAPPTVGAEAPIVTNQPWALLDAENRRYTSASSYWEHGGAQPAYPHEEQLSWGDCVRGWVIIQGMTTTPMTEVRYTGANSILEWKLS